MNYFDYLRMTKQEDTKENYIEYLIRIVGYTEKQAEEQARYFYKGEEN